MESHPFAKSAKGWGTLVWLRDILSNAKTQGPLAKMNREREREKWLADVDARQRNIVFPDTTQNEGRFWRNLGNPAFNTPAKIGLLVLGGWVASLAVVMFGGIFSNADDRRMVFKLFLGMAILFGPIFAGIAWATHRTLRSLNEARKRKH